MLDPKLLRSEFDEAAKHLSRRGLTLDKQRFTELEEQRKSLQVQTEDLQGQRNKNSKLIGQAKSKGEDASEIMSAMEKINQSLKLNETKLETLLSEIQTWMLELPNLPDASVPNGNTEDDNQEVRKWGETPNFDFEVKDHVDLGESIGGLDFETAAKITGSRFVTMHGGIAKLHRALIQFMIDTHSSEHGYKEVYVPFIVNAQSLTGTGQLPKFEEDLFKLNHENDYYLIPTAEVPVTNIWRDRIAKEEELPIKYVCHSPCFRSEAGSYGKDTRGMIRQHQFEKVEMVQLVKPEASWRMLEELVGHAEKILQKLNLAYRVVTLCTGDLGFSSAKTYDIEVWLPAQNAYREISSCSNFLDFQARRLKARWKNATTKKTEYLHTLNGSGLAIGRTLVAILENYQNEDGSINIPEALKPYMKGLNKITQEN
jgi:seryl-tRNA synthetase